MAPSWVRRNSRRLAWEFKLPRPEAQAEVPRDARGYRRIRKDQSGVRARIANQLFAAERGVSH